VDTSILPSIAVLSSKSLKLLHVSVPASNHQTRRRPASRERPSLPPPQRKS
jgi:hypothetical protein